MPLYPKLLRRGSILIVLLPVLLFAAAVGADPVGPADYRCFDASQASGIGQAFTGPCPAESPFAQTVRDGGFQYFHFEDWESFNLNVFVDPIPTTVPGVAVSGGASGGVTLGGFSPDSDDGVIDALSDGTVGLQTVFSTTGNLTVAFDETELGSLPTHAGIVVTGVGTNGVDREVTAEFFGEGGVSLGTVSADFNQVSTSDSTDDAFLGWLEADGIESITVASSPLGGVNYDHLQYGREIQAVPALSGAARIVVLLGLMIWPALLRRRSRSV